MLIWEFLEIVGSLNKNRNHVIDQDSSYSMGALSLHAAGLYFARGRSCKIFKTVNVLFDGSWFEPEASYWTPHFIFNLFQWVFYLKP